MGWRLIGGGEFDCLYERLKMKTIIIADQSPKGQTDNGSWEGGQARPVKPTYLKVGS